MKTHQLKSAIAGLIIGALFASCSSTYESIGKVNILSNCHVNPDLKYKPLALNAGTGKKDLKNSTARTLEQAIQQVVKKVPGGRYMTNVTIYVVDNGYLAVSGNVWGVTNDSIPAGMSYNAPSGTNDDSEDMTYSITIQSILK